MEDLHFRPIDDTDLSFLLDLYGSTRQEEMKLILNWTEDQKATFIKQQFQAQHVFYQEQFKEAQFDLILIDEQPIGRLYQELRKDEIRIIDIALLPVFRNRGLGKQLMLQIMKRAEKHNLAVRIHVEQNNAAMHLYDRLGFIRIGDHGVYYLMEWTAPQER